MSRIRSKDTGPERVLRRALADGGLKGWRTHFRVVAGTSPADVAFTRWKVAVFVDGCFWHGHPRFFTFGKSGSYWDEKIARNKRRDQDTTTALRRAGWRVIRVWDFQVEAGASHAADRISRAVARRKLVTT
jgi:DNA mismatch endonuclease (patch repair protein)